MQSKEQYSVLASGSRANATYVELGGVRVVIDCGLSAKELSARLLRIGVDPSSIDLVLVTHEHSDHIKGLGPFCRMYDLPCWLSEGTLAALEQGRAVSGVEKLKCKSFSTGSTLTFKDLVIRSFPVVHDASEPVGFRLSYGDTHFAQVTDLGRATPCVLEGIAGVNALVLEANHDRDLLFSCEYPWQVKQRISSSHGHLSNDQAAELLEQVIHQGLESVVLGHMSENSNTPQHALQTVGKVADSWQAKSGKSLALTMGSPDAPTPLRAISSGSARQDIFSSEAYRAVA